MRSGKNHIHRPKIILFANTSWYLWSFRLHLMCTLRDIGYEIIACAPRDEYSEKITSAGFRVIPIIINRRSTNPLIEILLFTSYCRIIRTERPDIILTFTPKPNIFGTLAARFCGIPIVNNISGLGFIFIQGGIKASIVRLLYKSCFVFSSQVFFQNKDDMLEFINCKLVASDKAVLLPGSGVNTEKFAPRSQSKSTDNFTFLLVGRMLWDKGIGEFVEAAIRISALHQNVKFVLLGPLDSGNPAGIPLSTLNKWTSRGEVAWLGSTDDVRDAIANADCVVLPSYREGMPRTLLEAASMAKPIITTDEPGCRDAVVDGVTGFLCRSHDVTALTEKMELMLLLSPDRRQAMGIEGRVRVVRDFDEHIVIKKYIEVLKKIKPFCGFNK